MSTGTPIPASDRVNGYRYAIRNIVAEAKRAEASGREVRYLNIGDPVQFGFRTPAHIVEAMQKAAADGFNGYMPSVGILEAREAVAADYTHRGMPVTPDRVVLTAGTSEGIELALSALADTGDDVLVPLPNYPLYTALLAKLGARAVHYRTDPDNGWLPDLDDIRRQIGPATRAIVVIDPNNPTGAIYPDATRRGLIEIADRTGVPILADEVYSELGFDGPLAPLASLAPDVPVVSFSSLSKGYLAPGWRCGWLVVGRTPRMDLVLAAIRKLADARLCSPGPMQYAVAPALSSDRTFQEDFRRALADRAAVTTSRLSTIPGIKCVAPQAAFYVMPQVSLPPGMTDEMFVLGLLRATGILAVHGSGFGMPPEAGFLRLVFLAPPDALGRIYDDIAAFTTDLLASPAGAASRAPGALG